MQLIIATGKNYIQEVQMDIAADVDATRDVNALKTLLGKFSELVTTDNMNQNVWVPSRYMRSH